MNPPTEEKVYVPRSIVREKHFERSGKTILKLSLHADTVAEFLVQHADAKGFVELGISQTRAVGKYGQTHCMWLDTWKPDPTRKQEGQTPQQNDTATRVFRPPSFKTADEQPKPVEDDVPF